MPATASIKSNSCWLFDNGHYLTILITLYGYLERTSCIGCGSGFQPRSFNFAAGSRSHMGFFRVTWTFRISALMNSIILLMNYPAAELRGIKMNFYLINPDAKHRGILLIKSQVDANMGYWQVIITQGRLSNTSS